MRKKLIISIIMSLMATFPSMASQNYFRIEKDYNWEADYVDPNGTKEFTEFADDFTEWQRRCAPYASGSYKSGRLGTGCSPMAMYITGGLYLRMNQGYVDEIREDMLTESAEMKNWLDDNMQQIVPEGTSKDEALKIIYEWIQDHVKYRTVLSTGADGAEPVWKALNAVKVGYANCVGYSSLYRDMVNYLVFDDEWNVRYITEKEAGPAYRKLNMLVVLGNEHAWNSLADTDGKWKYFDITFDTGEDGVYRYNHFNKEYNDFYNKAEYMVTVDGINYKQWIRGEYQNIEYYGDNVTIRDNLVTWK